MKYEVKAIVSREFLVTYEVHADSPDEAMEEVLDGGGIQVDCDSLEDGEEVLGVDAVIDEQGKVAYKNSWSK